MKQMIWKSISQIAVYIQYPKARQQIFSKFYKKRKNGTSQTAKVGV
ncbi:MAG: hypothetical protein K2P37_05295 [Oscillospiraceae bacterium]|nr:hypothetical protein [Oscillospiraceae bacterium]